MSSTSNFLFSAWVVLIGLADISDTAWRKRLRRTSPWLEWLQGGLLAAAVAPLLPICAHFSAACC